MENYPGNRRTTDKKPEVAKKETKKIVESVVSGAVEVRKKPLGKRFAETFFGGDARGAAHSIFFDVMIPSAKDMLVNAGQEAIERMFYGEVRSTASRNRSGLAKAAVTNYRSFSTSPTRREEPRQQISRRARERHDFDEILFETRVDAEEVLDGLFELLSTFEVVTVADMYSLAGKTGEFTDENWGWTSLQGSNVLRARPGWILDLPRPEPLS